MRGGTTGGSVGSSEADGRDSTSTAASTSSAASTAASTSPSAASAASTSPTASTASTSLVAFERLLRKRARRRRETNLRANRLSPRRRRAFARGRNVRVHVRVHVSVVSSVVSSVDGRRRGSFRSFLRRSFVVVVESLPVGRVRVRPRGPARGVRDDTSAHGSPGVDTPGVGTPGAHTPGATTPGPDPEADVERGSESRRHLASKSRGSVASSIRLGAFLSPRRRLRADAHGATVGVAETAESRASSRELFALRPREL